MTTDDNTFSSCPDEPVAVCARRRAVHVEVVPVPNQKKTKMIPQQPSLQQSSFPQSRHRGLNFLLVDDDDICIFIHRRVLELSGYCKSTHAASNGKRAIDFLNQTKTGRVPVPDVILLDLDMPLMNGIGFLEAFQLLECPDKKRIAIVLLSSTVSDEEKAHAMALGATKCLSKPLTEEALHSMIGSLK